MGVFVLICFIGKVDLLGVKCVLREFVEFFVMRFYCLRKDFGGSLEIIMKVGNISDLLMC